MAEVPINIAHVARLARLALTEEESLRFGAQFARLFDFIKELQALDTSGVSPTAQVIPLTNVLRDDNPRPSLKHEAALANAPEREGDYFKGPRILES